MKQILLTSYVLIWSVISFSQTVIMNPKTGMSTTESLKITKIELTDSATVLYFHTTYAPNNWISIPKETFIQVVGSNEKLFITNTKGIPLNDKYTMSASGVVDYQLVFPKLNGNVTSIDYGEANGGGWNIFDIQLKKLTNKGLVPEELCGNWINSLNGRWELSFFGSAAIYKNQVWKINQFGYKNGKGTVVLKNENAGVEIRIKKDKDARFLFGEPSQKLISYSRNFQGIVKAGNEKPYEAPLFKMDTAIYCGYITNYSPRSGIKTFSVFADNVITGSKNPILVKIADNGAFTAKIPLCYPHSVYVKAGVYNGTVFLEPGTKTFQLMDSGETPLFMGDCAKMNADLNQLRLIDSFNRKEMDEKILEMPANQYKLYCKSLLQHDLDSLNICMKKNAISANAYQIMCLEKEFNYASTLLNYNRNFNSAYRKKNNIPQSQRSLPVKPEIPQDEYYGFITNELVNNQLAVITSGYNSFINSLKYADILRKGAASMQPSIGGIAQMLKNSGYIYTEDERRMIDAMKETETPESKEFQEKYAEQIMSLYMKHLDVLRSTLQEKRGNVLMSEIEKLLTEKGVSLTKDEKDLIKVCIDRENSDSEIKNRQTREKYQKEYLQFMAKNNTAIGTYFMQEQKKARNETLSKKFGIQPGLAMDVMNAQDVCQGSISELTPITDEELQKFRQQTSIPFIADYVEICNNKTKAEIDANKKLKIAVVNEVPKVESDKLFDAIVAKYKGKVIYVDFWATWCAPCRSGIEQIKPLKEEMAGENVAFVYISGPSSPKATYDNMIPAIRGEHYRLSASEWDVVCKKFNVTGIPHYVLVGKDGTIINPQLGHLTNEALKALLMKYLN